MQYEMAELSETCLLVVLVSMQSFRRRPSLALACPLELGRPGGEQWVQL